MIPNEKYVRIVKGLLDKTKRKEVPWKPLIEQLPSSVSRLLNRANLGFDIPTETTVFKLSLPNSNVLLAFDSPATDPDAVGLYFLDKQERVAGGWRAEEGDENWSLAFELFDEVSKQVNKWDKVLDDVEQFIGKP